MSLTNSDSYLKPWNILRVLDAWKSRNRVIGNWKWWKLLGAVNFVIRRADHPSSTPLMGTMADLNELANFMTFTCCIPRNADGTFSVGEFDFEMSSLDLLDYTLFPDMSILSKYI